MARAAKSDPKARVWMQIGISLIGLILCLFIIASPNFLFPNPDESVKKVAVGWIGFILGYWLA